MSVWRIDGPNLVPVRGTVLHGIHEEADCIPDQPCTVHRPSDHHMRTWSLIWREDRSIFERACPHGIGHPDPDQTPHWKAALEPEDAAAMEIHGCDGCCWRPS